ncbi:MAG TPA: hypothetical protein VFG48_13295 [Xanthomonadales bacterium]|nr:hypothetical protein [Xanthomonadales bacterium]
MNINRWLMASCMLALAALTLPSQVAAQWETDRHPKLTDRFLFSAGAFVPQKTLDLRVDGSVETVDIGFDERLGLSSEETTGSGEVRWRFGEKWSLSGQYFETTDSATAELSEDISWEDYVLRAGSNVIAGIGLSVARVFAGRTFNTGPNHEFGLGFGLHWLEISAFLEGEFFVNDESTGFRRESVSADAPLPNIGGWYWYALSPRWLVTTRVDWFGASIGDYSGDLWNANAGVTFQAWRNVGFSLSYQFFKLNVEVDKSDWHGGADLTYHGPYVAANINW